MSSFQQAVTRTTYRLSFREVEPREFGEDMLLGPRLPNACGPGTFNGDWCSGDAPQNDADVEEWFAHFAEMAVGEAVHEVLEWLRVDGQPWLNPHGPAEFLIHPLTNELVRQLAALRVRCATNPPDEPLPDATSGTDQRDTA